MKLTLLIWFFIAAVAAALPIPLIKQYTNTKQWIWIVLSIVSYLCLITAYSIVLKDENITIVYPILKVLSVIVVVLSGLVFFYNSFDMKSLIGILFGILSIYILSSKLENK